MIRIVLCSLALLAACASTPEVAPVPQTEVCPEHDIAGDVRCLVVRVPEDRVRPRGRQIDLEVMVLAARARGLGLDPLVVVPGGPGQSATRSRNVRRYFAEAFDGVRERRDVVLIAPRGTAGSNELALEPPNDLMFASLDTVIPPEWARAGRERLETEFDLTQYTTENIVEDIEATRRALGYERLNFYGTSYGTRVVQRYAVRFRHRVRSIILKSPIPMNVPLPLTYTPGAQQSLSTAMTRCAAEPACARAHPNLAARFDALMERLRREPAHATLSHPVTQEVIDVAVTDTVFGYLLRNVLMSASGVRTAIELIELGDRGEFEQAAALLSALRRGYARDLAGGMALSVIASEDAPFVSERDLSEDAQSGFLRGAVARGMMAAVRGWPAARAPRDLREPLRGDVPTLLIAGAFDPATPPDFAYAIAAGLSRARVVVFPGGSHSAENFDGLNEIMTRFVEVADASRLDLSAATENKPVALSDAP